MNARSAISRLAIALAGALAWAGPAMAQTAGPPLDQGYEDIGPLRESLRVMRQGLLVPTDFDDVRRVPGSPDLLMRQSGAVTAIFSRSDYVSTRDGVVAALPAGTIFMIGTPPLAPEPEPVFRAPSPLRDPLRLPTRADVGVDVFGASRLAPIAPSPMPIVADTPERPTLWTDDQYRARRLRALVDDASSLRTGRAGG